MNKLMYFMVQTDGLFNQDKDAVAWPVDRFLGFQTTNTSELELTLNFLPMLQYEGIDSANEVSVPIDTITITFTATGKNKHKEVMAAIMQKINSSRNPLVTIIDNTEGINISDKVSAYISSFAIALAADAA